MMTAPQSGKVLTKVFLVLVLTVPLLSLPASAQTPLSSSAVPKFVDTLPLPFQPMPQATSPTAFSGDYYEIAARQAKAPILSCSDPVPSAGCGTTTLPQTTGWAYGPARVGATANTGADNFFIPGLPILAQANRPVRVKWINDLVCHDPVVNACNAVGQFVSYPAGVAAMVDNHWANPPRLCDHGPASTDCKGTGGNYGGPVPLITHLHGIEGPSESDGLPEAWYLPNASTAGFSTSVYFPHGSDYCQINASTGLRAANCPNAYNNDGSALFQYANHQFPTVMAYHDHSLGVTEQNVYMGLAGAYVLVDVSATDTTPGPSFFDEPRDGLVTGGLPFGDCLTSGLFFASQGCFEKPLIIQDKTFDTNGNLLLRDQGNIIVVNGKSWPYLNVEPRKYRFHIANLASSNVFALTFPASGNGDSGWAPAPAVTLIGGDQGFLPHPVLINKPLSLASAERADVIVDFSSFFSCVAPFSTGCPTSVDLLNTNGSGDTGKIMRFNIVPFAGCDQTNPADPNCTPFVADTSCNLPFLTCTSSDNLPRRSEVPVNSTTPVRQVSIFDNHMGACGPLDPNPVTNPLNNCVSTTPLPWDGATTETPVASTTEIWEMWDYQDSHPMHTHSVSFEVINRENMTTGQVFNCNGTAKNHFNNTVNCSSAPLPLEAGAFKDTVLVNGGQITRVKIKFTDSMGTPHPGLFAWHCHFAPHEDNEMMRPMCVQSAPGAAGPADGFSPGGCPTQ